MGRWYQQRSCSPLWQHSLNRKGEGSHSTSCLSNRKRARTGPGCLPTGFPLTSACTWCRYSWSVPSWSASPGPPSASVSAAPQQRQEDRELRERERGGFNVFYYLNANITKTLSLWKVYTCSTLHWVTEGAVACPIWGVDREIVSCSTI